MSGARQPCNSLPINNMRTEPQIGIEPMTARCEKGANPAETAAPHDVTREVVAAQGAESAPKCVRNGNEMATVIPAADLPRVTDAVGHFLLEFAAYCAGARVARGGRQWS